ncbi:MAG: hypothetical protein KF857_11375 [Fimbriimonadaceae bacterium]|nr:hypothetical protein [Fimbriimonadaceae bacterium]
MLTNMILVAATMTQTKIDDLAWLAGEWQFERSGRLVTEHWSKPAGGTMIGYSRTVRDGKTTEYEFLIVRADKAGVLEYVAKPSGQAEAVFKLIKADKQSVVFENKGHDFPQRILYTLKGDDLTAAIEGNVNGQGRRVEFPYQRVK